MPDEAGERSDAARDAAWRSVLGRLEARLASWRDAAEGAGPAPGQFAWPDGVGPCPGELRPRALALLAAQRELEAALAARLAALDEHRRALPRRPPAPVGPALFVDTRS